MDGRGGCCIAGYTGGGGSYDASKIDRIMLRFRPIAPKPATGSGSDGGKSVSCDSGRDANVKTGRGKKRHVRDGICTRKKYSPGKSDPHGRSSSNGSVSGGEKEVTLPLLPENTLSLKEFILADGFGKRPVQKDPISVSFDRSEAVHDDNHVILSKSHVTNELDRRAAVLLPRPMTLVGSTVTVECVTDTWLDGNWLGSTDEETMMNLEIDTCPGFIADGLNVKWVNGAYRGMLAAGGRGRGGGGGEAVVWLVMKERALLPPLYRAFTCRVRVVTCGNDRRALTLPCGVWRMDCGGFAWRLDIEAALSLGR